MFIKLATITFDNWFKMSWVIRSRFINIVKQFNINKVPVRTITQNVKLNQLALFCATTSNTLFPKTNLELVRYKHNKKNQKQVITT